MLTPPSADFAADGLYEGTAPATELPAHGVKFCRESWVILRPLPLVATVPIWFRFSACTRALRTAGFAAGWPGFSLKKSSFGCAGETTLKRLADLSSRARSAPETPATLSPPLSRRLAAVLSFVITFSVTFAGIPSTAVVAPFGPQV